MQTPVSISCVRVIDLFLSRITWSFFSTYQRCRHKRGHRLEVTHRDGVRMEQKVDAQKEYAQQTAKAATDETPYHILLDASAMAMS